ncbi:biopolymer transporter ExbD [Rhizobacter sp. J219]|jgi:biopolymer transport protein TolR|uniref:ExbD/TolR family protein n=1 Tax=Rhizobacter sp. J219 TaxID=2898430 RepID=UPI002150DFAC|nr:biopolymer transporter ExbD [Rhizobacter sp. J219]MCR5882776.1 biopolymer transporter ExbD [Rhizobacter sp. J219]
MKMTGIEKRAARLARNQSGLDMNLVALIDIFTILIFFLMSSTGIEVLTNSKAVKLPDSIAEKAPRETIVVAVSDTDIVVDGRRVASVAEANAIQGDLIPGLKAELDILASRQVVGADKDATAKAITIMGDKNIPYSLLRKVMYTSARANFSEIAFAVNRKT